jgi:hypothetical protein
MAGQRGNPGESGLTNRQTAEALFVTVKPVETHLARAYAKLGIGTRAELTRTITASRALWLAGARRRARQAQPPAPTVPRACRHRSLFFCPL